MARLQVRPIGYALGAAVTGVDLTRPLDPQTVAEIRRAWLDHLVLCFPNQILSKDDFVRFVQYFGEIDDNRFAKTRDPEYPLIRFLSNQPVGDRPWDGYKEGQTWHSDLSHSDSPPPGTFVLAKTIPDVGGDTMFANQYMAYETLSPAMQNIVDGLSLVHDASYLPGVKNLPPERIGKRALDYPPVVHPAVRVHPETGRKALYVSRRLRSFIGMTDEESKPLLDFLCEHATRYELTYRHRWTANDLIVWDNRCLMHMALSDYDMRNQARVLWRSSLRGPKIAEHYRPTGRETAAAS